MFTDIRLQNFRSYSDGSFELSDGVNIIVGPNASGKTNLLEAVMVTMLGSSYRVRDPELLRFNSDWSRIDMRSDKGARTVKLLLQPDETVKKEYIIDEQKLKKLQLNRTIPTVLFEPNHLLLLSGSPDMRRDYMDNLLEQITPGYGQLRKNYRRALAQRNSLLKQENPSSDQLFVWNLRLSDLGGQLALHRQALVANISKRITGIYNQLSSTGSSVIVSYATRCDGEQYSSSMLTKLESQQSRDIMRGFTGYGPHRDDMSIELNGYIAQDTASRGEMRTLLLALKVIELQILEEARGSKPVLLLDDVFSELDGARRKALTEFMKDYQTFITTTDADIVAKNFTDKCNIILLTSPS